MEKKRVALYLVALVVAAGAIFLPGFTELQKLREENEQLQKRIVLLRERNEELEKEILKIQQEPEYVEEKAREKLGIIRKGEIIYKGEDAGR